MHKIGGGLQGVGQSGLPVEPDGELSRHGVCPGLEIEWRNDRQNIERDALRRNDVFEDAVREGNVRKLGDDVRGGELPALRGAGGIEVGDAGVDGRGVVEVFVDYHERQRAVASPHGAEGSAQDGQARTGNDLLHDQPRAYDPGLRRDGRAIDGDGLRFHLY